MSKNRSKPSASDLTHELPHPRAGQAPDTCNFGCSHMNEEICHLISDNGSYRPEATFSLRSLAERLGKKLGKLLGEKLGKLEGTVEGLAEGV